MRSYDFGFASISNAVQQVGVFPLGGSIVCQHRLLQIDMVVDLEWMLVGFADPDRASLGRESTRGARQKPLVEILHRTVRSRKFRNLCNQLANLLLRLIDQFVVMRGRIARSRAVWFVNATVALAR